MSQDDVAQSQLLLAQGLEALADTLNNAPTMQVSTRDVITTLEVPTAVQGIQVQGASSVSDGQQGVYYRASSSGTTIQSADGSYWELSTPTLTNVTISGTASLTVVTASGITASGNISGADMTATGSVSGAALINGSNRLLRSSVSLDSTSGASTATLTNSHRAGNPSKWISIDDNGVTRWFPTWT